MSDRMFQVRPVQPTDAPALQELVAATLGECLGTVLSDDDLNACVREYQADGTGHVFYVADEGGELAGYAVAAERGATCGPVERLYVRHANHGAEEDREVACALVNALCGRGGETQVAIPVASDTGSDIALELYDRWGFVDVNALKVCLSMPSGRGRLMDLSFTH